MDAIIIRKLNLPDGVNGMTVLDSEGDYNIYLNDRLSFDAQAEALRHEVAHIQRGHFHTEQDLKVLEEQAKYG